MSIEAAETQTIKNSIYTIRGCQLMLDSDLAEFCGVEPFVFDRAFQRNAKRFLSRFGAELTNEVWPYLKSQFVMSKHDLLLVVGSSKVDPFSDCVKSPQRPQRAHAVL